MAPVDPPAAGNAAPPAEDSGAPDPQPDAAVAADGGVEPMEPAEIPAPVTEPVVWGFGLGTSDMPAAVKFYTEIVPRWSIRST
jgi:hypothetical protein